MRSITWVPILLLAGTLLGCSKKPDINKADAEVNDYWKTCSFVKISNLKSMLKEDSKSYRIAYTYDLEVIADPMGLVSGQVVCTRDHIVLLEALAHDDFGKFKKGQKIDVETEKVFAK